jgi:endonuclease/exonuclease/phosphatase family metal-dependent hydrolase
VLSWNLFHGRSLPPAPGQELAEAFAELLASWPWDVALLQEVPPWWPARLGRELTAQQCTARTSRNALLPLRRALAERWPELTRSNGGGANAMLVRGQAIVAYRSVMLRRRPERRVAQLARLQDGTCIANLHASTRVALAEDELRRLWHIALRWTGDAPLVLGGDLNLRSPEAPAPARHVVHVAARDVDHIFARGLRATAPARILERGVRIGAGEVELSDHPPPEVDLTVAPADGRSRATAAS